MGIDLKVLASHFRERRGEFLATAELRLERDPHLFSQLGLDSDPCLVRQIPEGLRIGHYEDDGLHFDTADRRGDLLTYTTPAHLQCLQFAPDHGDWNRAVLAFLRALPPDTRLVLYWC